jgi:hypothetical protein
MNAVGPLFALVLLLFGGYYFVSVVPIQRQQETRRESSAPVETDGVADWVKNQLMTADGREYNLEQVALAKVKQIEFLERGRKVLALQTKLQEVRAQWLLDTAALLRGERGKVLAQNDSFMREFTALKQPELSPEQTRLYRLKITTLLGPVEKAALNTKSTFLPEAELVDAVGKIEDEMTIWIINLNERRRKLEGILQRAEGEPKEIKVEGARTEIAAETQP